MRRADVKLPCNCQRNCNRYQQPQEQPVAGCVCNRYSKGTLADKGHAMETPFSPIRRLSMRPVLGRTGHVVRIDQHDRLTFAVCSPLPEWFGGHWAQNRTTRCTGDEATCIGCQNQLPIREKGYLTVCHQVHRKPMLLELTPGAGDYLASAFPHEQELRGALILVYRLRKTMKSPLVIERVGWVDNADTLPPPIDPLPTLLRLWAAA